MMVLVWVRRLMEEDEEEEEEEGQCFVLSGSVWGGGGGVGLVAAAGTGRAGSPLPPPGGTATFTIAQMCVFRVRQNLPKMMSRTACTTRSQYETNRDYPKGFVRLPWTLWNPPPARSRPRWSPGGKDKIVKTWTTWRTCNPGENLVAPGERSLRSAGGRWAAAGTTGREFAERPKSSPWPGTFCRTRGTLSPKELRWKRVRKGKYKWDWKK